MGNLTWQYGVYRVCMVKPGALSPQQQLDVLAMIWDEGEEGYVFLPWIPGNCRTTEQRKRSWHEGRAFEWPRDREDILKHLEERSTDELYFTPSKFLEPARVKQAASEEVLLWADLDEADPTMIDPELMPSIAWQSSPGRFQGVWLMDSMYIGASDVNGPNHRLSVWLGADPSGFDTTQLLRVPGRPNYKPAYREENDGDPVEGELMWARRRIHKWDKFLELPPVYDFELGDEDIELEGIDRYEVWSRVRLKVNPTIRQYMAMRERHINPDEHDRSEVLWQIERELADAGCTVSEIVAIVKPTPWNKHAGRRNEMNQLRMEAIKAKGIAEQDAKEDAPLESDQPSNRPEQPIWLSSVLEKPIPRPNWLVQNIWARGTCGFIAAEPKSYKSYFALDMAASIATGTPFLNDFRFSTKEAPVLYLQEEDAMPLVMHRLAQILEGKAPDRFWAGAMTLEGDDAGGVRSDAQGVYWEPPSASVPLALHVRTGFIASDPGWQLWLQEFIAEHGFALTIIDTLGTTLGDLSVTDDRLYPRVLNPLKEIAVSTKCGIQIVHHNRKNTEGNVRRGQMMTGSGSFHAWVESALYLHKDEHETGKPATIKVERENKLAQDMKFRVVIPPMFEERGHEEEGKRQIWEPEVRVGWGESDGDAEVLNFDRAEERRRDQARDKKGFAIAEVIQKLGKGAYTFQEISDAWHADKKYKSRRDDDVRAQLERAVANSQCPVNVTEDGCWEFIGGSDW